jgi:hypothetical protein
MRSQKDIDMLIDSFIETELHIQPNPFLSTRVMASIGNEKERQNKFYPAWQSIVMFLGIVASIVLGIKAGSLYHTSQDKNDQATTVFMNDDKMEHFVFYQQTANE